jgi:hypothetical protein
VTDRRHRRPARLLCCLSLLAFWLTPGVGAADPPAPPAAAEEEAPAALFDQKLGDVGVAVDAQGTWTTRLAAGWGEGLSPQGVLPGLGYPGYDKGVVFSQVPDFTLTLRLVERYYLAVVFGGSLDDRSFEVGYTGQEGEPVQWVRAGNVGFDVPDRAGQSLPKGRQGAPAAGAAFSLGPVDTEVVARYEDGARETRTFRGYQDVAASTVGLDQWIRARFFRLPGNGPFTGVRVLAADPGGTLGADSGTLYRAATPAEATVDTATGEIRLAAPATRRYLVSWTGASADPLGWPVATETIAGTAWSVLVQPGTPSPFELRNRYPVPTGVKGAILLYDNDANTPLPAYTVSQAPALDWFEVGGGSAQAPFATALGGALAGLYPWPASASHPVPPPSPAVLPWAFRVPPTTSVPSYALGSDVEPSSLTVVRNGIPTTAYQFDPASGTLKFPTPVFDTDTVQIAYQRKKTGAKASDLVWWEGGKWTLSPDQDLQWNLQGRWNLDQGRFTTEDLQAPGRMAASVAYRGKEGPWTWSVAVTGGALLADSTGHRRLYSQTNTGTQAALDGDALRPSAAPGSILTFTGLDESHRAFSYFWDFWSNDPLTGQAQVGAWGTPGVGREPQTDSGWTGPFLVRGDGQVTDRLAVADGDLGPGQWTGLQVFVDRGKVRDLSSTSGITVPLRLPQASATSGVRILFQAGTLSRDFDGTGAVKTLTYRSKPALALTAAHPAGQTQYFPVPEDSSWGNDPDTSGTAGSDGTLVSRDLTGLATWSDGAWHAVTLDLTDAERQLLRQANGWRLVAVNPATSGSAETTVLLAGPVVFGGSSWSVVPDGTASAASRVNLVEQASQDVSGNHELVVTWDQRTSWTVEGRHNPVRPPSFRALAFRYRNDSGAALPLTVTLADGSGHRLAAAWTAPPAPGTWVQARIDLKGGGMTLDGAPVAGSPVTLVSGAAAWDRMAVSAAGAPATGTLVLGEVEAVDPVWEPVGTTLASAGWRQTAPWPSADLPLVSGLTVGVVSSQAGLRSEDFSWKGLTSLAGTLGPLRATGEASYAVAPGLAKGHGAYEATLPLGGTDGPRLEAADKFSDEGLRADRLALGLPWVGTVEAKAQASGPPATLVQTYRAGWTSPGQWPDGWGGTLTAGWTQTTANAPALEGFARQWADSWSWLVPGPDLAPFALVDAGASAKGVWGPVGWSLDTKNQVAQALGPPVKWSPSGTWELKVPILPGEEARWTLTPSLSRKVEGVFSGTGALDPGASAREAAAWLWTTPGGLASAPFAEWAPGAGPGDGGPSEGPTARSETKAGLDWTREAESAWTDLVVPQGAGATVTGIRGWDGASGWRAGTVEAHARARGLNLFGTLGSAPLFSWYRTETLTWNLSGSWGTGTRDQDQTAASGVDLRADVFLTITESVGLPVVYKGQWGATSAQTLGAKPSWSLKLPADLPFDLPRWLSPKTFHRLWVQDLSAGLDFTWTPTPSPVLRNLEASWKGRLLLSDKSELDLGMKWGQQWQQSLTVVGLLASLDLVLTF